MSELKWWETATIYQIYPRSFQDSNGDGIGDLPGISSRLEYIANLGVDAVWISPFYKSPQNDFGYDVSDYYEVNSEYGSLDDFDNLLLGAHKLGLKVMIDIVPAHCSSEHPWFIESRKSKENDKADWFHWADPLPDGSAPTNWLSFFGGRAWTWEPRRQQYYLHNFLPSQPNLNFANKHVRCALKDVAMFWFDRGVDGFRLDAVHTINADHPPYIDNLPNPHYKVGPFPKDQQPFFRQLHDTAQLNQPAIQEFIQELRLVADAYDGNRFLMGELDSDNDNAIEASKKFTASGRLHSTYNFDFLEWKGLDVSGIKAVINKAVDEFNGTGNISFAFSNHDVPRVATRQLKALKLHEDQAEAMQLMLLKLSVSLIGSTCIFQGEELGLEDVQDIPIDEMKDPWGIEFAPEFLGRDTCRTPMVWDSNESHCGFSTGNKTWLPISRNHFKKAALEAANKPRSIYCQFSEFLKWRKKQPAMTSANNMTKPWGGEREIIFERRSDKQNLRCIFDFYTLTAEFKEV